MKNKKQVANEIIKLRKVINLTSATEVEKSNAWCAMLTLQWMYTKSNVITPCNICKPNLKKWD
jgi:hypothetical protein